MKQPHPPKTKTNDALHAQLCRVLRKLDAQQTRIERRKAQAWRAYKRNFKRALRAA